MLAKARAPSALPTTSPGDRNPDEVHRAISLQDLDNVQAGGDHEVPTAEELQVWLTRTQRDLAHHSNMLHMLGELPQSESVQGFTQHVAHVETLVDGVVAEAHVKGDGTVELPDHTARINAHLHALYERAASLEPLFRAHYEDQQALQQLLEGDWGRVQTHMRDELTTMRQDAEAVARALQHTGVPWRKHALQRCGPPSTRAGHSKAVRERCSASWRTLALPMCQRTHLAWYRRRWAG